MKHEEIQKRYKNHLYLSYKNMGEAKRLVGDVIVVTIFVNDKHSKWNERKKQEYMLVHKLAMTRLMKNARLRGVKLKIETAIGEVNVDMDCSLHNDEEWTNLIMKQYKEKSVVEYQKDFKGHYKCDEAPVVFVFNKPFRCGAISVNFATQHYGEMAFISSDYSVYTIIHELLHQFGARDLYFPRDVRELVESMGYKSVMGTYGNCHIDSLTSYLIGWSDRINDSAVRILEKTKDITNEKWNEMLREEWGNT